MTLAAGTRLGPYEILSPLGAGGMGEVYRARDGKLNRDVAIKVLPEAVAEDAERLARFQREAQVLASLNHPHIAAIYGFEKAGNVEALVLELVEGETLAERIAAGPVPIDEALAIARQIADALEGAHEKGIVHRDLKPANVKITPQGKVKVLDFGLAKALTGDRSSPDVTHSPTLTAAATQAGVVIGTAAYMSPEQARGKAVDKRADIWAFGAVLYEMLAGRKAFEGETVSDMLAAVLRADIDWNALPRETPASVRRVLRRCLDREPKTRFHDIADARIEMDETVQEPSVSVAAAPAPSRSRLGSLAAAALIVLAALGWWRALSPASVPPMATRLSVVLPAGDQLPYDQEPIFALSRNGRQLVFVAKRAGVPALYLRAFDAAEARPIEGTSNATSPFFSPDGGWIGFFADGKLKKVAVGGGLPIALSGVSTPRGGAWLDDDSIIFSPEYTAGLMRISAGGGKPEVLTRPDVARGERTHRWPEALPGGADVLFTVGLASSPSDYDGAEIAVLNMASRKVRRVFEGGSMPRYVPPGRLAFLRGDSVLVAPFDPRRVAVTGAAVPVVEKVSGDLAGGSAYYAMARTGTLVYARGVAPQDRTLVMANRKGETVDVPLAPRQFVGPRFSPDGKRLAFSVGAATGRDDDVWTYDLAGDILTRLTFGNSGLLAVWSPDGKRIAYGSVRGGAEGIYVKSADGGGREEALNILKSSAEVPTAWSADGGSLAFLRLSPTVGIWLLPLDPESKAREVEPGAVTARLSPDGRWIAYQASVPGDIFVRPTDGSPGKWQITTDRGSWPLWAGNEIFFIREGGDILSVEIETRPTFRAGAPRVVYQGKGRYDVRGDKDFWGADPDIDSIAHFIRQYVSDNGRWNSPKYILGESYGTTRAPGIIDRLQDKGMAFNGVVLVSVAMDLGALFDYSGNDRPYPLILPSYAAVSAYHKMLPTPPQNLDAFLNEVRQYAAGEYASALLAGDALPAARRAAVVKKLHEYTGLSEDYIEKANLRLGEGLYSQELLRQKGATVGRLDARFVGPTLDILAKEADYDPQASAISAAYIAAFLAYYSEELKFGQGKTYMTTNFEIGRSWDFKHKMPGAEFPQPMIDAVPDLARAMILNPNLRVLVQNGTYDLATPIFATETQMNAVHVPANLRDHVEMKYYPAGHMMYVYEPSLKAFKADIAAFIDRTSKP